MALYKLIMIPLCLAMSDKVESARLRVDHISIIMYG